MFLTHKPNTFVLAIVCTGAFVLSASCTSNVADDTGKAVASPTARSLSTVSASGQLPIVAASTSRESNEDPTMPRFVVPKQIRAVTSEGKPVELTNGGNVDFVIMATWCPYSKQMKRFMNDPATRPYLASRKLIFLFSNNEWADVQKELKEAADAGQMRVEEIPIRISKLKEQSGSPYVFDPSFLDDLPGEAYFCKPPKEANGYPSIISGTGHDKVGWMFTDLNMPEELMLRTYKKYAPRD